MLRNSARFQLRCSIQSDLSFGRAYGLRAVIRLHQINPRILGRSRSENTRTLRPVARVLRDHPDEAMCEAGSP